jgi:hypothetical protein
MFDQILNTEYMKFSTVFYVVFLIVCLNSCDSKNKVSDEGSGYVWKKVSDSAEWSKSYNFQMMNVRDTLWTLHPDGNWYTMDGIHWKKSTLTNVINNHAFLDYVSFDGAIYGLGNFNGNIEKYEFKPEIYKSTDFKNWETIATNSNLPERYFYHPFVYRNKIWIVGGEDKNNKYADIWNSEDGILWVQGRDNVPFGKRSDSQVVSLNNRLYLLNNDVWSSGDGLSWQRETEEILSGESVFGYKALVFDQKIWLLGCNRNGLFTNQVMYSSDGKNWKTQNAPWLPRGGVAATVYKNKIYMTGGKFGGTPDHPEFRYDNDKWAMEKR